jgi:cytochrome c oxidase subunit I
MEAVSIEHEGYVRQPGKLKSWLFTTDHKQIGILYIVTAWIAFFVGGLMALLVRLELMTPGGNTFIYDQTYTELFTVHAITMIFMFVMPMSAGFGNYFVPIQIGAKDMAYPRVNAFSFWLIPPAILMIWCGFVFKAFGWFENVRPIAAGWTGYVPLSDSAFSPGLGADLWLIGLQLLGLASIMGSINFIVTILKLRKPGMTMHHIPLFVWSMLVTAVLLLLATPSLTAVLTMLLMDRNFGTTFFDPTMGGSVLTWQHLFWFFGHPEVYILILPAMGMINEVLPRMTRKPIFGYHAMAWSMVAIGFLGFTVWVHHMFTTGIDPRFRTAFMAMTMAIGIPTGVKIFSWLATIWNGIIRFNAPLLFSIGFISMFVIGGINGVFTASIPVDYALHDTYWVVSHIHYVLFGGAAMGLFAGTYYWWPVLTKRMYSERVALVHFVLTFIGLNVVFFTMHFLGLEGMPRGAAVYDPALKDLNVLASIGAFILGFAQLFFIYNVYWTFRHGPKAPENPWDAGPEVFEFHPQHGGHEAHAPAPVAASHAHES